MLPTSVDTAPLVAFSLASLKTNVHGPGKGGGGLEVRSERQWRCAIPKCRRRSEEKKVTKAVKKCNDSAASSCSILRIFKNVNFPLKLVLKVQQDTVKTMQKKKKKTLQTGSIIVRTAAGISVSYTVTEWIEDVWDGGSRAPPVLWWSEYIALTCQSNSVLKT